MKTWLIGMYRRHRIPANVILAHAVLLVVIYTYYHFDLSVSPPEELVQVSLVTLPSPTAGNPAPQPPSPEPPAPEPVHQTPPTPSPPQPRPAKPKPQPSKPTPKVVKPTKTWKANSADDIRRRLQGQPEVKPHRTSTPSRSTESSVDVDALQRRLSNQVRTGVDVPGPVGGGVTGSYTQLLTAHLYRLWNQPSRSEVQDRTLSVTVRLTIRRDGIVTARSMTGPSGTPAMDRSVAQLLNSLDRCPAFPADMRQNQIAMTVVLRLQ